MWWTDHYPTAAHHLAESLGMDHDHDGAVGVGDGLAGLAGHQWRTGNWLSARRGPYLIGAVLSEAADSHTQSGRWLDLLDPGLPVITEPEVPPGMINSPACCGSGIRARRPARR